ncbi:ribosome maturation factor RimM [Thiohalomonas denitrificans]|uniref:ribosome maturation factor RimM n=1 Tax=Thiohalomonas denitrificans TaxID=415747 RepID=UPI0026EE3C0E|nr:ribosome maturation factor RimM [Thiohalomonas denitrificans]
MGNADPDSYVLLGRVSGLYGVGGWVKVFSHTQPRENILQYSAWYLREGDRWVRHSLLKGRRHGKAVVALLEGCDDREEARALIGADIAITREQLPKAGPGEYYWSDLIGLEVVTVGGEQLGRVDHLMETGANDVLVVAGERERLIPFVDEVIISVDLEGRCLTVDWDPEF